VGGRTRRVNIREEHSGYGEADGALAQKNDDKHRRTPGTGKKAEGNPGGYFLGKIHSKGENESRKGKQRSRKESEESKLYGGTGIRRREKQGGLGEKEASSPQEEVEKRGQKPFYRPSNLEPRLGNRRGGAVQGSRLSPSGLRRQKIL